MSGCICTGLAGDGLNHCPVHDEPLAPKRLIEIERALTAMGPYAMVGEYVTAPEMIACIREYRRSRFPQ